METQNNDRKLKILIGMLAVLLIGLGVFASSLYSDFQRNLGRLENEKQQIEDELQDLIANYDQVLAENKGKDASLLEARERIERLLDSVKQGRANYDLVQRYRTEVSKLKLEKDVLFRRADSLQQVAAVLEEELQTERQHSQEQLGLSRRIADSLAAENVSLGEQVAIGAALKLSSTRSVGTFARKSGKAAETDRARRAEQIKTCFTLDENQLAEAGDRLFYIQIIDPQNNVVGERSTVEFEDNKILTYSTTVLVYYDNKPLEVCIPVDAGEQEMTPGRYNVFVFEGDKLLAATALELR